MKRFYLFLCAVLVTLTTTAQGILPEFSTEENPVWYQVQFYRGSACLTDQGSGKNLKTAAKATTDNQKWQFIGTQSSFKMKSKAGNYVSFANSRFATNSTGTALKIVATTNSEAEGCWEIQRTNSAQSMNQVGGAGAGRDLGEWSAGDPNNPLSFVAQDVKLPKFSNETEETWYFIQFKRGGNTLADTGLGQPALISIVDPCNAQLWKLVGTQDNFQIVNKDGHYLIFSGPSVTIGKGGTNEKPLRSSATPYEKGFSLVENTSEEAPAWSIKDNSHANGYGFNAWGGTDVGSCIGLWANNDKNNALVFTSPEDMIYPDFKAEGIASYSPENKLTLWYKQPATLTAAGNKWMEYSLPIGNGQFGASLFGGICKDEIQFNEKTLWSGSSTAYGYYENFGSVYAEDISGEITYSREKAAKNYYRQLDITNATAKVSYTNSDESVTYTREYFASNPDNVIAARYSANETGKLNLRFTMASGKPGIKATTNYADGEAYFAGKLATVSFNARIKVINKGGELQTTDEGITVTGADEVIVLLAGGTDFDAYSKTYVSNTTALAGNISARINDAAAKGWDELLSAHINDYKSFFDRVDFDIDGTQNNIPTNEMVDTYNSGNGTNARMLEQLYFAYGRYLEISASRGVDLPSNLQGIWNNNSQAPWHSDIHANINVQMNYWPSEPTNLSETHLPFLNYIINEATNHTEWSKNAKSSGQNRGWTCFTENNIFGGGSTFALNYVIANAWYCTHLWQHYRYTLDREYLKRAFPAMLSASQFWLDRLKMASDGTYVCPNEYSPEQGPSAEDGTAHSQQLVYELLDNTRTAISILGEDADVSEADLELLNDRLAKLDRGLAIEKYTGKWGATVNGIKTGTDILREWKYSSYESGENGHRHKSHLMCLYPFGQVTPSSPYFKAAVNSLQLRGDASTGWSMGWKINLWARALDGNHAHKILTAALRHSTSYGTNQAEGGIYYNLYDSHAPFQIDGNYGACAGIAEMLMQSHTDTIQVLPALPSAWKNGHVNGLKAIGDFTVDVTWKNGKATLIKVVNNQGQPGVVAYPEIDEVRCYIDGEEAGESVDSEKDGAIDIPAKKGCVMTFDFSLPNSISGVTENAQGIQIHVDGRNVSLSGKGITSVNVYDLQGKLIKNTKKASFKIDKSAGHAVVVEALTAQGKSTSFKVALH